MPGWALMWATAAAIYGSFKWLTYDQARRNGVPAGGARAAGYLLAWPGMDAAAFLCTADRQRDPRRSEWTLAALNTALGATLIWLVARTAYPVHPLLTGWLG